MGAGLIAPMIGRVGGLLGDVEEYLVTRSVVSWAGWQADGQFPVGKEIGNRDTRIGT